MEAVGGEVEITYHFNDGTVELGLEPLNEEILYKYWMGALAVVKR